MLSRFSSDHHLLKFLQFLFQNFYNFLECLLSTQVDGPVCEMKFLRPHQTSNTIWCAWHWFLSGRGDWMDQQQFEITCNGRLNINRQHILWLYILLHRTRRGEHACEWSMALAAPFCVLPAVQKPGAKPVSEWKHCVRTAALALRSARVLRATHQWHSLLHLHIF